MHKHWHQPAPIALLKVCFESVVKYEQMKVKYLISVRERAPHSKWVNWHLPMMIAAANTAWASIEVSSSSKCDSFIHGAKARFMRTKIFSHEHSGDDEKGLEWETFFALMSKMPSSNSWRQFFISISPLFLKQYAILGWSYFQPADTSTSS